MAGKKSITKKDVAEEERVQFERQLDELASRIPYGFGRKELLRQALTHSSFDNASLSNYERLEFLGDRVLGLVVSDWLFKANHSEREGNLTKRLAWLVDEEHLFEVGRRLDLGNVVRIGAALQRDEIPSSIIADAVESIIGAIYLDGGMQAARKFVLDRVWDKEALGPTPLASSARNILQEQCAKRKVELPHYDCSAHGPDHNRLFVCDASVTIEGQRFEARGDGTNDSNAKIDAAKELLMQIKKQFGPEWPKEK